MEQQRPVWWQMMLSGVVSILAGGLTLLIASWVGGDPGAILQYAWPLFILMPLFHGALATCLLAWKTSPTFTDCLQAVTYGYLFGTLLMLVTYIEGTICLVMAAPLTLGVSILGIYMAHPKTGFAARADLSSRDRDRLQVSLIAVAPLAVAMGQSNSEPWEVRTVQTETIIAASPSTIWPHIQEMNHMGPPDNILFRLGLAHAIEIHTRGKERLCVLSTGTMPELIEESRPPYLLRFKVLSTPASMKELNPFGEAHPAHLKGYFECLEGQFDLESLPEGRTRIIGTSKYRCRLGPSWYWSLWTDAIVHATHERVFKELAIQASSRG